MLGAPLSKSIRHNGSSFRLITIWIKGVAVQPWRTQNSQACLSHRTIEIDIPNQGLPIWLRLGGCTLITVHVDRQCVYTLFFTVIGFQLQDILTQSNQSDGCIHGRGIIGLGNHCQTEVVGSISVLGRTQDQEQGQGTHR